jgi:hypothetical protein
MLQTSHTHEITGRILRQERTNGRENREHLFFALTDSESAERVTIETDGLELLRALLAQIAFNASLHDAKKEGSSSAFRRKARMCILALLCPEKCAIHRRCYGLPIRRGGRTFVEAHDDIRTETMLYGHCFFWTEKMGRTVEM